MSRTRVLATVGAWAALVAGLWATGAEPAPLPLAGMVAATAAAGITAFDLVTAARWVTWPRRRTWTPRLTRADPRAVDLRRQVRDAARGDDTELRDRLVALVDHRLMAHRGIDRTTAEGAAMLSPALTRLVAGRHRRRGALRELGATVSEIEEL